MLPSLCVLGVVLLLPVGTVAEGQTSLATAVESALRNSPKVKMAEDDLRRAQAGVSEARDAYVPVITGNSGLGASSGISLTVPTVFTISAQSLVFSASQRNYLRAARYAVQSSESALADTRCQVEEDTVIAYLSLEQALERQVAMQEEHRASVKLHAIVVDRFQAGLATDFDVKDALRTEVQIQLQQLQLADEVATLRGHLARLTGTSGGQIVPVQVVLPSSPLDSASSKPPQPTPKDLAAKANAQSKIQQAFGDSRNTWIPQVSFNAQYGRISPFNNVSSYYTLNGDYNTLAAGVQIQIPFLDFARKAKARESIAIAMHAEHAFEDLRDEEDENCAKQDRSGAELAAKAELAEIEHELAQDRLNAVLLEENANASNTPAVTPKDEQLARIEERQKYLDMLTVHLEVMKFQVKLLERAGKLDDWILTCRTQ